MPIKTDNSVSVFDIFPYSTSKAEPSKSRFVFDKSHVRSYLPDELPDL